MRVDYRRQLDIASARIRFKRLDDLVKCMRVIENEARDARHEVVHVRVRPIAPGQGRRLGRLERRVRRRRRRRPARAPLRPRRRFAHWPFPLRPSARRGAHGRQQAGDHDEPHP